MKPWYIGLSGQLHTSKKAENNNVCKNEYLWWIAFLRLSQDYWWLCHEKGQCQDIRLCTVWHFFGNIFEYDSFSAWWDARAEAVFAEKVSPPRVLDITLQNQILPINLAQHVVISIPLTLSNVEITASVAKIMQGYPIQSRTYQSQAQFTLLNVAGKARNQTVKMYQMALLDNLIRCVKNVEELDNQFDPSTEIKLSKMGYYEMATTLKLAKAVIPGKAESLSSRNKKHRTASSAICQKRKRVQSIIANVEIGNYMSYAEVKPHARWSVAQSKEMNAAIANGDWFNQSAVAREYTFLAGQLPLDMNDKNGYEKIIADINAFKDIGK